MEIAQQIVHYFFHLVLPLGVAVLFFRKKWKIASLVFLLTMLVDADHLLSNPVFSACRCSIGFHPLHSYPAILGYCIMFLFPKLRMVSVGLLIHMGTDYLDCIWSGINCR
ncbi:MAG: DUF6122 family protein [Chitinophagaceae bacterium]